jgi:hypothetical protein
MNQRANTVLQLLIGSLVALFFSAPSAKATQATTSDLTDYIVRLGGWFRDADDSGSVSSYHYWAQVSYALQSAASGSKPTASGASPTTPGGSPTTSGAIPMPPGGSPTAPGTAPGTASGASGSNITTLIMTKSMLQAESATGGIASPSASGPPTIGPPCSNGMTTTETVTLDLRELQAASTPVQSTETIDEGRANNPTITLWTVNLMVNGGKKLIRVNTVTSPPTCKGAQGSSVALPGGKPVNSTTSQKDVNTYPVVFADGDQAKYLQMLVSGLVPSLNPPRSNVAPLP